MSYDWTDDERQKLAAQVYSSIYTKPYTQYVVMEPPIIHQGPQFLTKPQNTASQNKSLYK